MIDPAAPLQNALAQTPGTQSSGLRGSLGTFPAMVPVCTAFLVLVPGPPGLQSVSESLPCRKAELLELIRNSWQHHERLATDDTSDVESTRGPPFQDHPCRGRKQHCPRGA